ncbi:MAG: hypothetical protein ACYC5A_09280 [Thermoleophilia bacterium]
MRLTAGNRRLLILLLAAAALGAAIVMMARGSGPEPVDSWQTDYEPTATKKAYTLADVRSASHMNVTVHDEDGQPGYLGWSGGSESMEAFTEAVAAATPTEGEPDETFADLIVFYLAGGESVAMSYSRELDLLMFNGQLYQPAGEIAPLIIEGEERYR